MNKKIEMLENSNIPQEEKIKLLVLIVKTQQLQIEELKDFITELDADKKIFNEL